MTHGSPRRLVTFLGTGHYGETVYDWPEFGRARKSPYVCAALAELWQPDVIDVLATEEARQRHEKTLRDVLTVLGAPGPKFHLLRHGQSDNGLWQQFHTLVDRIGSEPSGTDEAHEVLLDITHGFRAQPFFAGAVISLLKAIDRAPERLHVVYGEYRQDSEPSMIWNLDLFLELIEWARALALFEETGVAAPLVELGHRERSRQARSAHDSGSRDFPAFHRLIDAIESLADDLATVRIAHLITGYRQSGRGSARAAGSACRVIEAIESLREDVETRLPPLALVLDRLVATIRPLAADRLCSDQGHAAQQALARWYLSLQRYPEAAISVREAMVNLHAHDRSAVEVSEAEFSDQKRQKADLRFGQAGDDARTIAGIRNDIEHGGFRKQPQPASALKRRVRDMVDRLETMPWRATPMVQGAARPRILVVSRHPGARQWLEQQAIEFDECVQHLDPATVSAGETVIGTFPIHLAAELCRRGARVVFLSVDLPEHLRGQELDAEQLAAFNARLEEFRVEKLGPFAMPVDSS